jgi:glucose/arabinose dehydrogenase
MRFFKKRVVIALLTLLAATLCLSTVESIPQANAQTVEKVFFPETGHTLSDEHGFLSYWRNNGGLAQFGYPTTPEIREMNPADNKVYTVQWFERNRFEYHPEFKGTKYQVLLGLLGRQLTIGREQEEPFRYIPNDPKIANSVFFPETGHTLSNSFKAYWEKNGGLAMFGYPITQEFEELNPSDGKVYVTQWFERARFEWHPEFKGTQYEVLLGLLGNQITGSASYPDAPPANVRSKLLVPQRYRSGVFETDRYLNLPPGFKMSVYAAGLTDPRLMAFAPNGDLFLTERYPGKIKILRDSNSDGTADETLNYFENLQPSPHGIAFYGGYLYIALETKVVRFPYQTGDTKARTQPEVIIPDLPAGKAGVLNGHTTRTITFGRNAKMYVSIGSSCDVCIEDNKYRAAIWEFNPDGSGGRMYAQGLRNSVALGFDPRTDLLWIANNGRNGLGDDFPAELLTPLRAGAHYGWPYCVGTPPQPDPDFGKGKENFCKNEVEPSLLTLPAHSAPLGLVFYNGTMFPEVYRGGLFVVLHGSFPGERSKVYADGLRFVSTRPGKLHKGVTDFATGWINPDEQSYWGRPVAPIVGPDGAIYVSDDKIGAIYRLSYGG